MDGLRRGAIGTPIAQKTKLGWVLSGQTSGESSNDVLVPARVSVNAIFRTTLDDQLKRFWEIEEVATERVTTADEQQCEDHYNETHSRDQTGRFTVRLPFLKTFGDQMTLGQSRSMAVRRLYQLEHRFKKMPTTRTDYVDCINGYLDLQHMERISTKESTASAN